MAGRLVDMSMAEYAAMWGCDPCYDKPPRQRGDGYLFYNYAVEGKDLDFLKKFLPAILRTIEDVASKKGKLAINDVDDLISLAKHVASKIALRESQLRRQRRKAFKVIG